MKEFGKSCHRHRHVSLWTWRCACRSFQLCPKKDRHKWKNCWLELLGLIFRGEAGSAVAWGQVTSLSTNNYACVAIEYSFAVVDTRFLLINLLCLHFCPGWHSIFPGDCTKISLDDSSERTRRGYQYFFFLQSFDSAGLSHKLLPQLSRNTHTFHPESDGFGGLECR